MTRPPSLLTHPIHLGLGATAVAQPEFTDMAWYADYEARTQADGIEGRLVSLYRFTESWDSWEVHPSGEEVVICLEGAMTLYQELADGEARTVILGVGDYVINPARAWHTADVDAAAMALFITPGSGTQHRPR